MSVVCSAGSGLYNKLITHSESYQVYGMCVSLCVILESQQSGSLGPTWVVVSWGEGGDKHYMDVLSVLCATTKQSGVAGIPQTCI